jgi:capsular polysaccharide biosynthesis protein
MSQQPLDLRRSVQIVRRHKILVAAAVAVGVLAGTGYAVLSPPMVTSQALVVLPPSTNDTHTQVMIASSDPVLVDALHSVDRGVSPQALRTHIQVTSPSFNVISISVQDRTAAQAERTANAVADSYVAYLGSGRLPGRPEPARVLQPATEASMTISLPVRLLASDGLGALIGAVIAAIAALAISRTDRRLRRRDEIAESIGVPVLLSIPAAHPSDAAGWKKLLTEYEPGAVDAWRLRKGLQLLGLDLGVADEGSGSSVAVCSLSHDRKALALGPQLAAFAASLGIPTALVLSPQQDTNATATLRAACRALPKPSQRLGNLRITVCDDDDPGRLPEAGLAVVVAVIDSKSPEFTDAIRTTETVLSVSAGTVTAEQLARAAGSAAADGRHVGGILVADPDPADHTTGRLPQPAGPRQPAIPVRVIRTTMEPRQ